MPDNVPALAVMTDLVLSLPGLQIDEESHSIVLLRLWKAQTEHFRALSEIFGVSWPEAPNTVAGSAPRILWLAPDTWAIVDSSTGAVREQASRALGAHLHHVSDVSEGRTVFRIRGALARTVMNKGCSLDLHPNELAPGRCAQTLLAQIPVLIEPFVDSEAGSASYRLLVDVSYARYLRTWFADAVVEYS